MRVFVWTFGVKLKLVPVAEPEGAVLDDPGGANPDSSSFRDTRLFVFFFFLAMILYLRVQKITLNKI